MIPAKNEQRNNTNGSLCWVQELCNFLFCITSLLHLIHCLKSWHLIRGYNLTHILQLDMFPYKKTALFQKSGFKSKPPKKPGNTPLSGTWFYFLDIKTTVSTCVETSELLSFLLVGLRKYVQRFISLWKHINGLQLLHCMFLVQLTSRITYLLQRII